MRYVDVTVDGFDVYAVVDDYEEALGSHCVVKLIRQFFPCGGAIVVGAEI